MSLYSLISLPGVVSIERKDRKIQHDPVRHPSGDSRMGNCSLPPTEPCNETNGASTKLAGLLEYLVRTQLWIKLREALPATCGNPSQATLSESMNAGSSPSSALLGIRHQRSRPGYP